MARLNKRNAANIQNNPQMQTMQTMQKVTPLIFGVIYIAFPIGVTVYFIVSSFCRIVIQEILFRTGVTAPRPAGEAGARTVSAPRRRGFMDKLADMQAQAQETRRRQLEMGGTIEASSSDSDSTGTPAKPAAGAAKRPARPRPPVASADQNNTPRPVKAKPSGAPGAQSDQGGSKEANKTNGSAGGQNGRPTSGNGRPPRASGRNGARTNGAAGQGNGETEDLKQKQAPPRSKDKRPRKAR
jgi:hypothetical protein